MNHFDHAAWSRREAYDFFSGISNPFYMVTFRQDVTGLYRFARENGLSFYYGMIWACTQAINGVGAFHLALRDGELVSIPDRKPSFTDLKPGAEQFHIVTLDAEADIRGFCRRAAELSRHQDCFIDLSAETDDLIYFSCLPWIELTALTNERDMSAPGARDDSIPRIAWGKYVDEGGRKTLGLSLEVNHRFIDGIHIGRFAEKLSGCIGEL